MNCVFCEIVDGRKPCHKIWEDEGYLAFLSSHPNTSGFSVVIPKVHYSSYLFDQNNKIATGLVIAAKQVGLLLDKVLDGVARTGMIFEGYGIDHLHAKLFPMHRTGNSPEFRSISSGVEKYFEQYESYISSHDSVKAPQRDLESLARLIRESA